MSLSEKAVSNGSKVFFALLKKQIVNVNSDIGRLYEEQEIEDVVNILADNAGVKVFQSGEHIHLIVQGTGSIFASTYTQMKDKYSDLKNKKYFYLSNIIICVFLAEVDVENIEQVRWMEKGVPYGVIIKQVTTLIDTWKAQEKEGIDISGDFGIALKEIDSVWNTEFSRVKEGKTDIAKTRGTKIDFIYKSLKPLADQQLIVNRVSDELIIPKKFLYDRIAHIYHSQPRFKIFKELINQAKKEGEKNA